MTGFEKIAMAFAAMALAPIIVMLWVAVWQMAQIGMCP